MLSVYISKSLTKKNLVSFLKAEDELTTALYIHKSERKCAITIVIFSRQNHSYDKAKLMNKIMVLTWIGLDSWHHKGFHKHRS